MRSRYGGILLALAVLSLALWGCSDDKRGGKGGGPTDLQDLPPTPDTPVDTADEASPDDVEQPEDTDESEGGQDDAELPGEDLDGGVEEEPPPPEPSLMGQACNCDEDCLPHQGAAGICSAGICMLETSAPCSGGGSSRECPDGARCWAGMGMDNICWPDCEALVDPDTGEQYECVGICDRDGSCAPTLFTTCLPECSSHCPEGNRPLEPLPAGPACDSGEEYFDEPFGYDRGERMGNHRFDGWDGEDFFIGDLWHRCPSIILVSLQAGW